MESMAERSLPFIALEPPLGWVVPGAFFCPATGQAAAMPWEMSERRWKNRPETAMLPGLLEGVSPRVQTMRVAGAWKFTRDDDYGIAQPPETADWKKLHAAAAQCEACPLYRNATQTVFGE